MSMKMKSLKYQPMWRRRSWRNNGASAGESGVSVKSAAKSAAVSWRKPGCLLLALKAIALQPGWLYGCAKSY
jgi:hypothetical protein